MLATLLARTVTAGERIQGVHRHFAGHGKEDETTTVILMLVAAVLLCGVLLLLNRIQRERLRREEEAHSRKLRAMVAGTDAPQLLTSRRRQATAPRPPRTGTRRA